MYHKKGMIFHGEEVLLAELFRSHDIDDTTSFSSCSLVGEFFAFNSSVWSLSSFTIS